MAHKTFISYKYSDAVSVRDRIIKAMGEDAKYYNGENGFSPNKSDDSEDAIWEYLKDMIWGTSVTIVVLSPQMLQSSWIESEISYSLKKIPREGTQSKRNGVVAVIKKVNGSYDWFKYKYENPDGHSTNSYHEEKVFDIIKANRWNQNPPVYSCDKCKSIDSLTGSYIAYVEEDEFCNNIDKYIENAFQKSQNDCKGYDIKPTV
jgi:hypothetical protein